MNTTDKNSSMIFYESYMLSAKEAQFTPAQRCEFYEALLNYVCNGKLPEFNSAIMRCLFTAFKANIDNNIRKLAKHRIAVENGKKGAAKRYSANGCKSNNNLANGLAKNQNDASIYPSPSSSPSSSPSPSPSSSPSVSVCSSSPEHTHIQTQTQMESEGNSSEIVRETFTVPKTIKERNLDFYKSLLAYIPKFGLEHISKFYEYWGEPTQDRLFLRFEKESNWNLEARLNRWRK